MNAPGLRVQLPLTARRCGNCACYFEVSHPQNPLLKQGFCRLEPPSTAQVRVEVPMLDANGHPMMTKDKQGKPVPRMEGRTQLAYTHDPTQPESVCFDGWRPLGTQPGDDWGQHELAQVAEQALIAIGDTMGPDMLELLQAALSRFRRGPNLTPAAANDDGPKQ